MHREVVHDDDIPRRQGRHHILLDIRDERLAIHRPVDHQGRGDPIVSQRRDEGRGLPVTMRGFIDQALPFGRSSAQAGHIRGRAGFINENQLRGIQRRLVLPPSLARRFYVRPVLFGGEERFF